MNTVEGDASWRALAFGSEPGTWPLPTAVTPYQRWLRAVAAGGQGRFASARTDLAALLRECPDPALASLAYSTQGSFLRQLGWHALARGWDGRALALTEARRPRRSREHDRAAVVDALVGLAADALGIGRFALSATLLTRATDALAGADVAAPRLAVRLSWVAAELAMVTADGDAAVRQAERAVELTGTVWAGSARHRLKSDVVLASALCCAGRIERARGLADAALDDSGRLGLVPLRWALACLLTDIGSATRATGEIREIRDASAALVAQRGGRWRHR